MLHVANLLVLGLWCVKGYYDISWDIPCEPKKCNVYFCNSFVRPSILIILARVCFNKFPIMCVFPVIFIKSKTGNQLKFQECYRNREINSLLDFYVWRTVRARPSGGFVARRRTSVIAASCGLWLPNITDFSNVNCRILAVLHDWVYQKPLRASWGDVRLTVTVGLLVKHLAW